MHSRSNVVNRVCCGGDKPIRGGLVKKEPMSGWRGDPKHKLNVSMPILEWRPLRRGGMGKQGSKVIWHLGELL